MDTSCPPQESEKGILIESTLEASSIEDSVVCTNLQELDLPISSKYKPLMTNEVASSILGDEKEAQTCTEMEFLECLKDQKPLIQAALDKALKSEIASAQPRVTTPPDVLKSSKSETVFGENDEKNVEVSKSD